MRANVLLVLSSATKPQSPGNQRLCRDVLLFEEKNCKIETAAIINSYSLPYVFAIKNHLKK